MKASVLYKWLTYSAIAISILLCLFMLQAGLKGNFRSVDAFQAYIRGFGLFAPFVFVFIQAFQVVVPVLPGFIGCVAGALLFGSVCGFVIIMWGSAPARSSHFSLQNILVSPWCRPCFHPKNIMYGQSGSREPEAMMCFSLFPFFCHWHRMTTYATFPALLICQ